MNFIGPNTKQFYLSCAQHSKTEPKSDEQVVQWSTARQLDFTAYRYH